MGLGDTTTLEIATPEGVRFSLPLAGPPSRALAWFIDFVVLLGVNWTAGLLVLPLDALSEGWAMAVRILFFFGSTTGYGVVLEWAWNGQTLGKRALRLRVVDEHGLHLTLSQAVVRNLLRAVDSLPLFYAVGGAAMVLTRRCQRLGDVAAGTVVVRTPPARRPQTESLLGGRINSFRDHPLQEARLRQQTSPEEARLVLSSLLRRDELTPACRLRVYRELADHFRAKAEFPVEVTATLSDEQYLRNVADSLFRRAVR